MFQWYKKVVFENYANFSGRARRSEYWFFVLFNMIFAICAMVLDNLLGLSFDPIPYGWFYISYVLAVFIPGLAVAVRRLHDVNKSGWFFFIVLVPIIGSIWLLVLFFSEGTKGKNNYGEDPKGTGNEINQIGNE
jgi:uncharacterized membrane protein YhaH (DUF805 family)